MITNKHQTSVAAEAFAAGVFAQAGYSVFVQYGANQPGYDLVVSMGKMCLQVNVKGSKNGGWILTSKGKNETDKEALCDWIERNREFSFCLVQFDGVEVGQMPQMYLATADEIAKEMEKHWFGKEIALSLGKYYAPNKGPHKGQVTKIPDSWSMTSERIKNVFTQMANLR